MRRHWLLAAVSLVIATATLAETKLRKLNAGEVRQTLIGKVISDGYHWRYHLKENGSIDGSEMGRPRNGRWHLEGSRLCIVITAGAAPDQCWDVMREGKNLVFAINGSVIYDVKVEEPRQVPKRQ